MTTTEEQIAVLKERALAEVTYRAVHRMMLEAVTSRDNPYDSLLLNVVLNGYEISIRLIPPSAERMGEVAAATMCSDFMAMWQTEGVKAGAKHLNEFLEESYNKWYTVKGRSCLEASSSREGFTMAVMIVEAGEIPEAGEVQNVVETVTAGMAGSREHDGREDISEGPGSSAS